MADDDQNNGGADLTPSQDEVEWGQAADEFAQERDFKPPVKEKPKDEPKPEDGKKPEDAPQPTDEEKKAEQEAADKKAAEEAEAEKAKGETPEQTEARHKKEAEDAKAAEEAAANEPPDNPETREYRQRQREIAEDEKAIKADIRKEMFSELQTELLDADGDPIRTIEDVQKLMNPNTGKPFTDEEAAAWLLAAQRHLRDEQEKSEKRIDEIAQVNLDIRDWSNAVRKKYGEFIKANPDVWKPIWAEYEATLVKDEKTEIITKAPVNLERFAEVALAPHIKLAEQVQKQAEEDQKNKQEQDRKKTRTDRSDVVSGAKTGVKDKEEEEWEDVAKEYYEGK